MNRWNCFSGIRINTDLTEVLEKKLIISYTNIKTKKISLSLGGKILGFRGKVEYRGINLTSEEAKWLGVLTRFSQFSGVGRKTTMGLGMTEGKFS